MPPSAGIASKMAARGTLPRGPVAIEECGDQARLDLARLLRVESFLVAGIVRAARGKNITREHQHLAVRRRQHAARAGRIFPELPWCLAARVQIIQLLLVLKGVHRSVKSVVRISHQELFVNQALEGLENQFFAIVNVFEDLRLENEKPAVDAQIRFLMALISLTTPSASADTTW